MLLVDFSICRSSSAITCSDCLSLGPECNWCSSGPTEDDFTQNRIRCGTRQELIDDDCNTRDIVKIKIGIEKERNKFDSCVRTRICRRYSSIWSNYNTWTPLSTTRIFRSWHVLYYGNGFIISRVRVIDWPQKFIKKIFQLQWVTIWKN